VLIKHFPYRRSSHRRKGAARHLIDISLAYPSGEDGGILMVQMISTCLRGA
jgi:hypothetical protein